MFREVVMVGRMKSSTSEVEDLGMGFKVREVEARRE